MLESGHQHHAIEAGAEKKAAMALDLKPVDYLWMLKEEYREYRHTPAFVRKAIICCALSNAMPEIIFAEYGSKEPVSRF